MGVRERGRAITSESKLAFEDPLSEQDRPRRGRMYAQNVRCPQYRDREASSACCPDSLFSPHSAQLECWTLLQERCRLVDHSAVFECIYGEGGHIEKAFAASLDCRFKQYTGTLDVDSHGLVRGPRDDGCTVHDQLRSLRGSLRDAGVRHVPDIGFN